MILTVSGWRDWPDPQFVVEKLRGYHFSGKDLFWRVGCARGVDEIVRGWLMLAQVPTDHYTIYRAEWARFGKPAGMIRNGYMLRGEHNPRDPNPNVVSDRLLAFPQPSINWKTDKSGTVGCILDAVRLGIDLDVPGYSK